MKITYEWLVQSLVQLCVLAILLAVAIDFLLYQRRPNVKRDRPALVRTSTMILFFVIYYLVIRLQWGVLVIAIPALARGLDMAGLAFLLGGAAFNIFGRFYLSRNWGDNIKIYTDHFLVTTGPYRLVRHPLYASLMWMFGGGALVYRNYLALLLDVLVFVPMMTWRARQEEQMLIKEFPDYAAYSSRTGMFFPKLGRR